MIVLAVPGIAEGLAEPQRLQAVAALLGVLIFGVIVLVAERRNHSQEAVPPGRASALTSLDPPREVRRGPAAAVPISSAREAAAVAEPVDPYPVPFLGRPETGADAPPVVEG